MSAATALFPPSSEHRSVRRLGSPLSPSGHSHPDGRSRPKGAVSLAASDVVETAGCSWKQPSDQPAGDCPYSRWLSGKPTGLRVSVRSRQPTIFWVDCSVVEDPLRPLEPLSRGQQKPGVV